MECKKKEWWEADKAPASVPVYDPSWTSEDLEHLEYWFCSEQCKQEKTEANEPKKQRPQSKAKKREKKKQEKPEANEPKKQRPQSKAKKRADKRKEHWKPGQPQPPRQKKAKRGAAPAFPLREAHGLPDQTIALPNVRGDQLVSLKPALAIPADLLASGLRQVPTRYITCLSR